MTKKVLTYCEKCPNKPALCSHCFLKSHGYLPPRLKVEKSDETSLKVEKETSNNDPLLEKSNVFEGGDVTFPRFDDEDNQSNLTSDQITPRKVSVDFDEKDTGETSKSNNDPTWNVCIL